MPKFCPNGRPLDTQGHPQADGYVMASNLQPTLAEQFVLRMAPACYERITRQLGSISRWSRIDAEHGAHGARLGRIGVFFDSSADQLVIEYSLLGLGIHQDWDQGRCKLWFDSEPFTIWDFYCAQEQSGIFVQTMTVKRRSSLSERTARNVLDGLGHSDDTIARHLAQMGYTADADGILSLIAYMFGTGIKLVQVEGIWRIIVPSDDAESWGRGLPVPSAVVDFMSE